MTGLSIEATLELWASSLRDVKTRMRPLFTQERVAVSAGQFLDGLLGEERRKTGWMRAQAAGDAGPWRQQAILGRGQWDADALRNIADGDLAFFSTWCPAGTSIETLVTWRGIAGRSKTASRPPRTNLASTTTRPAPGTAGIAMSRWSCSLSP